MYIKHAHTVGEGIPIIIMGVHFGSEDLAAGGRLQTASDWAAEVLLDSAPDFFEGFEDYLDIYVYIGSEEVHPVPTDGYVESYWDKWDTACALADELLGKDSSQIRMVYLGNSDNTDQSADQVGGFAP